MNAPLANNLVRDANEFRRRALANGFQPIGVRSRDKAPASSGWQNSDGFVHATSSAANTGILTRGLRAVDIDVDELGAVAAIRDELAAIVGKLGPVRVRGNSARLLVLYAAPPGECPPKRIVKLGAVGKVEILGDGQQFVAHGIHPSGEPFEWPGGSPATVARDDLPILDEDQELEFARWLRERFGEPEATPVAGGTIPSAPSAPARPIAGHGSPGDRETAYARAALDAECGEVAATREGGRNDRLNRAALKLGHHVAAGWIGESEVVEALTAAALECGLDRAETAKTIRSGLTAGKARPSTALRDRDRAEAAISRRLLAAHAGANPETGELPDDDTASGGGTAGDGRPRIAATPFAWRPAGDIPPRAWLYGRHLSRKHASATFASGGIGKSSLLIAESLSMASGRPLLGSSPVDRLRVWIWAGEDPIDETERRIGAAMLHYGIAPAEIEGRLFVNSGRDMKIVLAEQTRDGTKISRPVVDAITATIREHEIDVFVVDPFISSHRVTENDNNAIDVVAKEWVAIADRTGCAIELVHHVKKTGGAEATVEDGRGAVALLGAVRSARVLNRMSEKEAADAGVDNPFQFFRLGGNLSAAKANLTLPSPHARWFKMESVALGNGSGLYPEGDLVGVVTPWKWPDAFAGMTTADLLKAQRAIDGGRWRKDLQSRDWVGKPIATALGLDSESKVERARIKTFVATWIKSGALVEVEGHDERRNTRIFVEVGEWATE